MGKVGTIRVGGIFLISGALAFMGVFAYLAAQFNYPQVLDGSAAEVLPSLLATGTTGRAVWAIYGFLPLIWIPAGVGAFHALRGVREGSMRVAMLFAVVSAISMMLGLLRWPSIHWTLAQVYAAGTEADRTAIGATFAGLNIGMFRNVSTVVEPVAAVNNYLLPLWMIIFGVALIRHPDGDPDDLQSTDSLTDS
jgi:hypothetical protein